MGVETNNGHPALLDGAVNDAHEKSVHEVVDETVFFCRERNIHNPVEILRCFQQRMVTGRALEVESAIKASEGDTNFIMVDRHNLIDTAFVEIMSLPEYRKTLQVQFYGEVSIFSKYTYKA